MLATLPMYDWPEAHKETDAQWHRMRDALRAEGVETPDKLDRSVGYVASWARPDLVLGQACGLPLAEGRTGPAAVIGAMKFGLPDCEDGAYYSHLITRLGNRLSVGELSGRSFAVNDLGSQSGYGVLRKLNLLGGNVVETGSHRASIIAVAEGRADFAAIDAQTWRLAERFEPAARRVTILAQTEPTIAPAIVAAEGADVARYRRALDVVPATHDDYRGLV